eukprot:COSAG06_NODE_3390_length_5413_cov_5.050997_1_plen_91_part_10
MCSSCRIACVGISGGCVAPVSASGSRGDRSSRRTAPRADSSMACSAAKILRARIFEYYLERGQVTDDCLLVSCSALRVCVLLESGLEYSRI